MIKLEKVCKKYGNQKVLDDVSFQVAQGEFVSIVGHSGAGKSTLVNLIFGMKKIDSGNIYVNDIHINSLTPAEIQMFRRNIGMIFQDFKLLEKNTVFENIAFALEVCGYSEKEINSRVKDVLKVVGLEEKRNHFPSQLSGGEAQRCAIARALIHAPNILIADEPTGNLDPENAKSLADLLLKINKSGTTIILSTHNENIVNFLMKRVIKIKNGKIESDKKNSGYGK